MNWKNAFISSVFLLLPFIIHAQPSACFFMDTTKGCSPVIIKFRDCSNGSIKSWNWDFGNGNKSTYQNPQEIFKTAGKYTVKLTVSDGTNSSSTTQIVTVFKDPTADFVPLTVLEGCTPLITQFKDASIVGDTAIISWKWDFGDGNYSLQQNPPAHFYKNAGNFTVSLTVTDGHTCQNNKYIPLLVKAKAPPIADFSADKTYSCADSLLVKFTNKSTGTQNTYSWDFGNGNTSTLSNPPSQNYTITGKYDVKIIVTDIYGCIDSLIREEYIQLTDMAPSFNLEKDSICLGEKIPFNSTPVGLSSLWDFGDGHTSTQQTPNYTYLDTGWYVIKLKVTDITGTCFDSVEKSVLVETVIPDFNMDSTFNCELPFTVNLTDQSSTNSSLSYWNWYIASSDTLIGTFDTVTGSPASYTFLNEGKYYITVNASTASGCSALVKDSIEIILPEARFKVNPLFGGCADSSLSFIDQSIATPTVNKWNWDFGDGNTGTGSFINHTYSDTGTYKITFTIINQYGCTDTIDSLIRIGAPHIPDFIFLPDTSCAKDIIKFINISKDSMYINGWFWEFGDNQISTAENPTHLYTDTTGWFNIQFVVKHHLCPSDTAKDSVFILGPITRVISTVTSCDSPNVFRIIVTVINGDSLILDFGDGTSTTYTFTDTLFQDTIKHVYANTGNFTISAKAFNDTTCFYTEKGDTCFFEATAVARVRNLISNYWISDTTPCWDDTVIFDALNPIAGSQHSESFFWYFSDKDVTDSALNKTSDDSITFIFKERGICTIRLKATDINNCVKNYSKTINVFKPTFDFEADSLVGCVPFPVDFHFLDDPVDPLDTTVNIMDWDFGDNTHFNNNTQVYDTTHTYDTIMKLTVKLTVTDILGCQATQTKDMYIAATKPMPKFSARNASNLIDTNLCKGDSVHFINTTTSISNNIITYLWNFGDGNTSITHSPWHTFNDTGYFTVALSAFDTTLTCDSTLTLYKYIHVQDFPVVHFYSDSGSVADCYYPPPKFVFKDSTYYKYNYIKDWYWNFGDGQISTNDSTATHTYFVPDSFYVSLSVTTTFGCRNEDSILIVVKGPLADVKIPVSACKDDNVPFIIQNAKNVLQYKWFYGDGGFSDTMQLTGTSDTVYHTFDTTGIKNINLLIQSDACDIPLPLSSIPAFSINIIEINANFNDDSDTLVFYNCLPFEQQFSDKSNGATYWEWDFGDSTEISNMKNPVHIFSKLSKGVQLIVQNVIGCRDTLLKIIDLKCDPTLDVPSAFTPSEATNNKVFVRGRGLKRLIEFKIYNRWGQLVYESTDLNEGWDGTYQGKPQNIDTYVYMVTVETIFGEIKFKKGQINLLR